MLSVESNLADLRCAKCRKYLTGIRRFSSILLRDDGEAHFRKSSQSLAVGLWLHASSPLFEEVFKVKGATTEGNHCGQCPDCGRTFTYLEQPRGGEPGTLSIGLRPGNSTAEVADSAPVRPATPSPIEPTPPLDLSQPTATPKPNPVPSRSEESQTPARTKIPTLDEQTRAQSVSKSRLWECDTGWAGSLEHRWTAAWADGGSIRSLSPTPEAVWTELRSGVTIHDQPDVTALNRSTGEVVYQRALSELLGANDQVALLRPFGSTDIVFARDARHGGHLWSVDTFGAPVGLTSNAILSKGPRGNLVAALFAAPGKAPESWRDLSEPGPWTLSLLLVHDDLWTAEYVGPGKRIEVRRSSDFQVLWSGEYASDEKVTVCADSHGWVVSKDRQIECYDLDGQMLWSSPGPEMLSLSSGFVVGRYSTGDAGIWGGAEPLLGGFRRRTGGPLSLPQKPFEGRYCYALGGDILWCVGGRGPKLVGYDLVGRKVVKGPIALPDAVSTGAAEGRPQSLKCYQRDVYLTARGGHLVRWSGE